VRLLVEMHNNLFLYLLSQLFVSFIQLLSFFFQKSYSLFTYNLKDFIFIQTMFLD